VRIVNNDWECAQGCFPVEVGKGRKGRYERLTDLRRQGAEAALLLLGLVRRHWGVENRLHYVRDETLGEDRCRARKGDSAQVLAAIRNVAVHLLEQVEAPSKAFATRHLIVHPHDALPLLLA